MIRFISRNKQEVQIMEEWKIGEIRQIDNEWYQCLESSSCRCDDCDYGELGDCHKIACASGERSDDKEVYFKKLEKVGLPYYNSDNKLCQEYKCHIVPLITDDIVYVLADNRVVIEVKQNKKEDMEEKKIQLKQEDIDYLTRKIRYLVYKTNDYDRATEEIMNLFIPSDTEHSSSEKIGKNLKPFDLEAAKQGKPVCTRDGRKARILCFDRFCCDEISTIVACVLSKDGKDENVIIYSSDGFMSDKQHPCADDLMMLSEKKEGYANIYRSQIYDTLERAKEAYKRTYNDNNYLQTIKIEWEE